MSQDDDEFERLLGEHGFGTRSGAKGKPGGASQGGRAMSPSTTTAPAVSKPTSISAPPPSPASNPLALELAALRAELEALRVAEAARRDELASERAAARVARDAAATVRVALDEALGAVTRERDDARNERSAANRRLGESQQALVALKSKLERLARIRSMDRISSDVGEKALAMRALLERFPGPTLAALAGDDENALETLLQRVVFTCEQPVCRLKNDVARVSVPRDRCDVCGGSVLAQRYGEFVEACREAAITSALVVGGSPAYREALRDLSRDHRSVLKLELTQELAPNDAERAKKVKGLVIIWGGTEVDHTKTGIFSDAGDRRMIVAHRGLTGMLGEVTRRLQGLPPTPSGGRG